MWQKTLESAPNKPGAAKVPRSILAAPRPKRGAVRGAQQNTCIHLKITRGSGNVFADIGFSKDEAENLKLRAELMMRIEGCYRKSGVPQAAMAEVLGLTTPRLNALFKGKIGLFSLDALVNIASRAGLSVRLLVKKAA